MKALLVALVLFGTASVQAGIFDFISSETGNHCTDQARGYLRYKFGDDVKFISTTSIGGSDGTDASIWLRTNLCDDYFVATFVKNASCSSAHYGFVPIYIQRVWGYGDCAKVMYQNPDPIRRELIEPHIKRK